MSAAPKRPAAQESHSRAIPLTLTMEHQKLGGESDAAHKPGSLAAHHVDIREDTPNDTTVALNVGGLHFTTTLGTLRKYPDSYLGAMFSGRHALKRDETGAVLLDRDPMLFGVILQFLRLGACACA